VSRSRRRGGRRGRGKSQSPAVFWGHDEPIDDLEPFRPATDPTALVRSLGRAPLPGHETVAEHYFAAVYERAGGLALALAATTGLLAGDDDEPEVPDVAVADTPADTPADDTPTPPG
jgi:hypothetical protein